MSKNKPRFAVTGASGFLGSYMIQYLRNKCNWVRAITHSSNHRFKKLLRSASDIHRADLTDPKQTLLALSTVDFVFHFAADMGGVGYFSEEQYFPFVKNMQMDLNVFEACQRHHISRIFYPSSACVYPVFMGEHGKHAKPLAETMIIPADPDQMYGWEKLVMLLLSRHTPFETRVGILHTIFGELQEWSGPRAKFPGAITYKVLTAKKTKKPITIWGDGTQERTFLYISDAIQKIFEVMMSNSYHGEVNISSDEVVTVRQVADWLSEFAHIQPKYMFDTTKPSGVKKRGVDTSKFKKYYSYRDKITTKEGFRRVFEFMAKLPEFRSLKR